MSSELPAWFGEVTWPDDKWEPDFISKFNFAKGVAVGQQVHIKELEDKLALALEYQREVDANVADAMENYTTATAIRKRPIDRM